jgi:hypothetical protein
MREYTKAAFSLSWSLSLLGVEQVLHWFIPGAEKKAGDTFAPITQATIDQLDETTRSLYRTGNNIQARAVDAAILLANPTNWLKPETWKSISAVIDLDSEEEKPANEQQAPPGPAGTAPSGRRASRSSQGWGPMPEDES